MEEGLTAKKIQEAIAKLKDDSLPDEFFWVPESDREILKALGFNEKESNDGRKDG